MLASPAISTLLRSTATLRGRLPSLAAAAGIAVHVLVAVWVFAPALWGGRVLYFRDVSTYFYPNLAFLERSLDAGVLPLWHPGADAGAPFLLLYPVDLVLVALFGARGALVIGPPLHTMIASMGAAALGRRLGLGVLAAWTCGLVFALSGFMVSAVNLIPLHQAAAWAPLVALAALACAARPAPGPAALLAAALAMQVSTLAGEIVVQTAALAGVLTWRRIGRRGLAAIVSAGCVAALLSAPVLLGASALMKDTRRSGGFSAGEALFGSATPIELAGMVLPRFFGDMHTFTNVGFWGHSLFAGGFPYLLSLYAGLAAFTLALAAGRDRLWWPVAAAILLALGAHGPLAAPLGAMGIFRAPVKFLFLAALALALLAGRGLDRSLLRRAHWSVTIPAAAAIVLGAVLWASPDRVAAALASDAAARRVMVSAWPDALLTSGLAALGAAVVLARGGRLAAAAGVLAVVDLVAANGDVNRFAPRAFYELKPDVRALLAPAFEVAPVAGALARGGPFRVFGYGIGNTPGLVFAPEILRENSDVWLYYVDRQVLWGRTAVLDGLETALDEDRTAWTPAGAALSAAESVPAALPAIHERLRGANVRWILSFAPLSPDLAVERANARLPEVLTPLRLYELRDPWPRAFFAREAAGSPDRDSGATVDTRVQGPHTVELRADTPPGYVVLLSGWNVGWRAWRDGTPVEVLRAGARYIALSTPGGDRRFRLEFRPRWWRPSLASCAVGVIGLLAAIAADRRRARPAPAAASPASLP